LVTFGTARGEGAGVVFLDGNGKFKGGDSAMWYKGRYSDADCRFNAIVSVARHSPGSPSVFGVDKVDIGVAGSTMDVSAVAKGERAAGTWRHLPDVSASII
jgi:hypothetical protein